MWILAFIFERRLFRLALAETMVNWILKILPPDENGLPGAEAREFAQFIVTSKWFSDIAGSKWKERAAKETTLYRVKSNSDYLSERGGYVKDGTDVKHVD
jgi:hypothetical protein